MYFAKNLRFLRRRAELSQSELADKLATDYNTISRYEQGKSTPKLDALTKLAQVFDVSIEALRNQDLTQAVAAPAKEVPDSFAARTPRAGEGLTRPAKHPLLVSVELDGTAASRGAAGRHQRGRGRDRLATPAGRLVGERLPSTDAPTPACGPRRAGPWPRCAPRGRAGRSRECLLLVKKP